MSNHFNNSPAFGVIHNGTTVPGRTGLSMRDYFAAAALQGLLADDAKSAGWEEYAKMAYHIADAMVNESNIN
jgi:hypothetical protein